MSSFALFGLPESFGLDCTALKARYTEAIRRVHPDQFANKSDAERRVAQQWSVKIQSAYDELMDPVTRATALLAMHGVSVDAETNTAMPPFFLMRQMERHEALDDAGLDVVKLQGIVQEEQALFDEQCEKLRHQLDDEHDWMGARETVRVLMFLRKFIKLASTRYNQAQLEG